MRCAIFDCNSDNQTNKLKEKFSFYTFPKNDIFRKLWQNACCRSDNFNLNTARICSRHFSADSFERNLQYELLNYLPKKGKKLKPDAVPTLYLPEDNVLPSNETFQGKGTSSEKNGNENFVQQIIQTRNNIEEISIPSTSTAEVLVKRSIGVNTDMEIQKLESHSKALKSLFTKNQIKKLENPKIKLKWTAEELSKAKSLYSAGPKAYRLLLKRGYPFPPICNKTLKIKIVPGT